jgi:glycosyltransferase involved in cell wall biosynthesis
VVVPAFNEAEVLPSVLGQLAELYDHIVLVDDGSSDGTGECIKHPRIKNLRHLINRGQGAALQTGIEYSLRRGAEIIVTFDADGQHDPADIDYLLQPIMRGEADVTLGSRFLGQAVNIPALRKTALKLGIWFTYFLSGIRLTDVHNGLRAFSRPVAQALNIPIDRMGHASWIVEEINRKNWRYREVATTVRYTPYSLGKGQSTWSAVGIAAKLLLHRLR